ncbi:MAG: ATP-binding protein [Bacteroidales bacterium]|nr:ATP-binding protein [Bacteroidales bacterium]
MKIYPFKFLDSYTKDDKEIFFGRDDETNQLYDMLKQSDIVMLYGASGTGKTSLIQCGLSKKINDYDWLPFYIRRGTNINESIQKSLQKFIPENEESVSDLLDELFDDEPEKKQLIIQLLTQLEIYTQVILNPFILFLINLKNCLFLETKTNSRNLLTQLKQY